MITPEKDNWPGNHPNTSSSNRHIPWTTSRCNRLLRPIAARLRLLRKNVLGQERHHKDKFLEILPAQKNKLGSGKSNVIVGDREEQENEGRPKLDPDWMPSPAKKRVKRQYGVRPAELTDILGRQKCTKVQGGRKMSKPGEINVPTPFISRMLQRTDSPHTPGTPAIGLRNRGRGVHANAPLQDLKKNMTPIEREQIGGLFDSLLNLLKTTASTSNSASRGPKSLFSTCLHQVPTYIALERYWQKVDEDDEDADLSTGIYDYLEQMGPIIGKGWRPLRVVVRAHAVTLIQEAIIDGLFSNKSIGHLIRVCVEIRAFEEAQVFLASFVATQDTIAPPRSYKSRLFDPETSSCLSNLYIFAQSTNRWGFLLRQLDVMLTSNILPIEWMATQDMLPLWTKVIGAISGKRQWYVEAMNLWHTTSLLGCGLRSALRTVKTLESAFSTDNTCAHLRQDAGEALSNTIASLCTIFSTIGFVSGMGEKDKGAITDQSALWPLELTSILVLSPPSSYTPTKPQLQRATALIASLLLLRTNCNLPMQTSINTEDLIQCIERFDKLASSKTDRSTGTIEKLPTHVVSLARCCGRALRNDGFQHLQRIVQALIACSDFRSYTSSCSSSFGPTFLLKRLGLESALEFAEQTKVAAHLAFAWEVEEIVKKGGMEITKTPFKSGNKAPGGETGYRWEEGIAEWVICTPAINLRRNPVERATVPNLGLIKQSMPRDKSPIGNSSISYEGVDVMTDMNIVRNSPRQITTFGGQSVSLLSLMVDFSPTGEASFRDRHPPSPTIPAERPYRPRKKRKQDSSSGMARGKRHRSTSEESASCSGCSFSAYGPNPSLSDDSAAGHSPPKWSNVPPPFQFLSNASVRTQSSFVTSGRKGRPRKQVESSCSLKSSSTSHCPNFFASIPITQLDEDGDELSFPSSVDVPVARITAAEKRTRLRERSRRLLFHQTEGSRSKRCAGNGADDTSEDEL
ncbi:hypothetical protein M501DRAFT_1035254, partial [Patellaria atrata CBS 101060]